MKKILLIVFLFFSLIFLGKSDSSNDMNSDLTGLDTIDVHNFDFRYVENEAYGFGEKLEYKVGFEFIKAGTGYFHIMPKPIYKYGRPCYDIRFAVNSLKSLEWVYKVRDQYRTILDAGGIFPWQFEQHIREGGYKRDSRAQFDQVNNFACKMHYDSVKKVAVPEYVHDIVSAFFYVRTMDFKKMKKNQITNFKNFFDDTTYTLGVKYLGRQTIDVEAGKFRCRVIEPMVQEGGLFKHDGRIIIWLTDDERKIPVKVATKIIVGEVYSELTRYSGTRGKVEARLD
jgi:uncharacterized protein DUF3108